MRRQVTLAVIRLLFVGLPVLVGADVANAQTMKVACVGDSITAPASGWCRYLGMKLGSGYTAQTFGVSGTTLLEDVGQPSFSSSSQFKPSQSFAPHIVVIMLGTNDSMPRNWNAGKDHFVKDYEALIDSYTSLATKPTVFLNTAPPASDDNMFSISGTTIENEINPLIKQVAMSKMCPLVDVWAAFEGDVSKLDSFDGVHPGDAGQQGIAEAVAMAIKSPMIPGGPAGVAGAAGAAGAAVGSAAVGGAAVGGAGGVGQAGVTMGAGGAAGAIASAGGAGPAIAGAGVTAVAGTVAMTSASGTAGGPSQSTGASGVGGLVNAAGTAGSAVNTVAAAGTGGSVSADVSGDGGCRVAGDARGERGLAAVLLVVFVLVATSRRKLTVSGRFKRWRK